MIYILDILVNSNTSILTEHGNYNTDLLIIRKNYLNNYLLLDLVAAIPIDLICTAIGTQQFIPAFAKILRLCKGKRIYNSFKFMQQNTTSSLASTRLVMFLIVTIYFSHLVACISYYLGKLQYWIEPDVRFNGQNFLNQFPLNNYYDEGSIVIDIPIYDQYINLLYFGYSISSSGAYGDVPVPTTIEKSLNLIFMIMSMILSSFIIGEASNLASNYHKTHTDHLAKLYIIEK